MLSNIPKIFKQIAAAIITVIGLIFGYNFVIDNLDVPEVVVETPVDTTIVVTEPIDTTGTPVDTFTMGLDSLQ